MKKILTIAGFDPSAGAGITKDLEIFQSRGLHGISVPACLTNQGPEGILGMEPVPTGLFLEMLETAKNIGIDAIKIGALYNEEYVHMVVDFIYHTVQVQGKHIPVVLDTVFSSKNGKNLLSERGIVVLKDKLLPLVTAVTPNIDEATLLAGIKIEDTIDMENAARAIHASGAGSVVIKGGHIKGNPVDLLFDGKAIIKHSRTRQEGEIHGTGCVFSGLLASYLCLGYPVREAFQASEAELDDMLDKSYRISDSGYHYISPGIRNFSWSEKWKVIQALKQAAASLETLNPVELVPAVQMNIGFALPDAGTVEDVAAFPGRISVHNKKIYIKGEPSFGSSSHVARLILGMMRHYPFLRASANLKFSETFIEKAKKKGMTVVFFDRQQEPLAIRNTEGMSLGFLMEHIPPEMDKPPDIIYDIGDIGKEPMIRLFARTPLEIINKMEMIRG